MLLYDEPSSCALVYICPEGGSDFEPGELPIDLETYYRVNKDFRTNRDPDKDLSENIVSVDELNIKFDE